jgi:hypothetical protein
MMTNASNDTDMQLLETTIENAKQEYAIHMRLFLVNLRKRLLTHSSLTNVNEIDEMIIYVTHMEYNMMKSIVHSILTLEQNGLSDDKIYEHIQHLYTQYQFRPKETIESQNEKAHHLMNLVLCEKTSPSSSSPT